MLLEEEKKKAISYVDDGMMTNRKRSEVWHFDIKLRDILHFTAMNSILHPHNTRIYAITHFQPRITSSIAVDSTRSQFVPYNQEIEENLLYKYSLKMS